MYQPVTPRKKRKPSSPTGSKFKPLLKSPYFSPVKRNSSPVLSGFAQLDEPNTTIAQALTDDGLNRRHIAAQSPALSCISPHVLLRLAAQKPQLIQESVAGDPWKLLVAATLLNKTSGKLAIPVFWDIVSTWPTPFELSKANEEELMSTIRQLGTQSIRAKRLILLSRTYLREPPSLYDPRSDRRHHTASPPRSRPVSYPPTPISHLPGTGPYALDSYRIFCTIHDNPNLEEWKVVMPSDKELIRYLKWKWAYVENKEWSPTQGVICEADVGYIEDLIAALRV